MSGHFELLHPGVQRWIYQKQWKELRDIQDRAIPEILRSQADLLIVAATAAGKTEAALLPILTDVCDRSEIGLSVLYISPLKALINDQFGRLEELCTALDIEVVRWHGDAPQAAKQRVARQPSGIALITPESIEALLVRRPSVAAKLFANVAYVVLDELHYFLEGPRGLHLACLLARVKKLSTKRPRFVGLSATVGDLQHACRYLNPEDPGSVKILSATADTPELLVQVKGYEDAEDVTDADGLQEDDAQGERLALDRIADDIYRVSKGENNLIFAGSRRRVESLTDRLRLRSEKEGRPNEFYAHHGSLSKEVRHDLEKRLKDGTLPTSAVATTTLELGIDIGSVKATAQVGPPMSMASFRQRVGRSGRRVGAPAIMRMYIRERNTNAASKIVARLKTDLVRGIASISLLIARYIEPPVPSQAVATVVVQQILSLITEKGGLRAPELFETIIGNGALVQFPKADFISVLRFMASAENRLLEQAPNGLIMLGEVGEKLTQKRDFYAIFDTQEEWRVLNGTEVLGTVPLNNTLNVGGYIAFAGKRWRIEHVDAVGRVLTVVPHRHAKIPPFEALANEVISDRMAEEMKRVYESEEVYPFLDKAAVTMLSEARATYREFDLPYFPVASRKHEVVVFTWAGTKVNDLLALAFKRAGIASLLRDACLELVDAEPEEVRSAIDELAKADVDITELPVDPTILRAAKWDQYVPDDVLLNQWRRSYSQHVPALNALIRRLKKEISV